MDAAPRAAEPLRVIALALAIASVMVLLPFAVPLVLAAWLADITRGLVARFERVMGGHKSAAALATLLLVLVSAGPVAIAIAVLASGAGDLVDEIHRALAGRALEGKVALPAPGGAQLREIVHAYAAEASRVLMGTARGFATFVLDFVVLVAAFYAYAVRGDRIRSWLARTLPIPESAFDRLAAAFEETGRGLLVAIGGTALVQGVVATIAYYSLGVPHAALFGFLTATAAAAIPAVGTALVWVPIATALAVFGQPVRAIVLALLGIFVISTVDNVLRPMLARYAKLELPMLVLFLSMIGGLLVLGGAGLILGPLLVRMAVEALALVREQRVAA